MYKILLVCTGNTCRSPMLEALIKDKVKKLNKKLEVKSAGLSVIKDDKVNIKARKALKKLNIVIRHTPTQLSQKALDRADIIITMTIDQKRCLLQNMCYNKTHAMCEAVGYDIYDPYGGSLEQYEYCAKELDEASQIIVDNLVKAGRI